MSPKWRAEIWFWWLLPVPLLGLYVAVYLLSTEVFRGHFGGDRRRIRLFQSVWQERVFQPLLLVERRLRPGDPEFHGQVRSGASLPPNAEEAR